MVLFARRNSYTLVLHKHGELLYTGVTECVTNKLMETAKAVTTAATDALLETIVREWEHHKLMMSMIRDILMYMVGAADALHSPLPPWSSQRATAMRLRLRRTRRTASNKRRRLFTTRACFSSAISSCAGSPARCCVR